jgi:hypothetical protein
MDVSTSTSSGTVGTTTTGTSCGGSSFSIANEICHFGRAVFAQYIVSVVERTIPG